MATTMSGGGFARKPRMSDLMLVPPTTQMRLMSWKVCGWHVFFWGGCTAVVPPHAHNDRVGSKAEEEEEEEEEE